MLANVQRLCRYRRLTERLFIVLCFLNFHESSRETRPNERDPPLLPLLPLGLFADVLSCLPRSGAGVCPAAEPILSHHQGHLLHN